MKMNRLKPGKDNFLKNIGLGLLFLLIILSVVGLYSQPLQQQEEVGLSRIAQEIKDGRVDSLKVDQEELVATLQNSDVKLVARKESSSSVTETLKNLGVPEEKLQKMNLEVARPSGASYWLSTLLPILLPFVLLGAFLWFMMRSAQSASNQALGFGQTRARPVEAEKKKRTTFADVAGSVEAKNELVEIVDFLKSPKKFQKMGARIPKGVLLVGPPGTGKTLIARAVAGEASVPFFTISGSEFVEMFVGVGASVSGDTNVLIKANNLTRLLKISDLVDQYYQGDQEGFIVPVDDIKTLGVDFARGTKFFGNSSWKNIRAVYRHKVDKVYEIQYIGGSVTTTADHSVFVREKNHILPRRTDELKIGDTLVSLPFKTRSIFKPHLGTTHKIKIHAFPNKLTIQELPVWIGSPSGAVNQQDAYQLAPGSVAHAFVGYERNYAQARLQSPALVKVAIKPAEALTYSVPITKELCKIIGYYTAEGWHHARAIKFGFDIKEKELHNDCTNLMKQIFNLTPHLSPTKNNALQIEFYSAPLTKFFTEHCGKGARNKHIPEFLWDAPREYFVSYLDGLVAGDGYINKRQMIELTSASERLISELTWLLHMHGMPCSVTKYYQQGGRTIRNGKSPLPATTHYRITIAKSANPFNKTATDFGRKATIKAIIEKPYDGYVYDLCGVDNEAFFGGEKPVLLHNSRVRDIFRKVKHHAPAILFVDELDAVGRHRGAGLGGGHDEREQTLNQILVEMDGFEQHEQVIIVAATNRPDVLDPALLRPGRFDRQVVMELPDIKEREAILTIHTKKVPLADDVSLRNIAERTPGFSGADLANLVNEAAILAARLNGTQVTQLNLAESIEKVLLGPEKRSKVFSEKEKKVTAYHEAGHAVVAYHTPDSDPVRKISIISRGHAGGYTLKLPDEDRKLHTKTGFLSELATLMGGYTAEFLKFNELTTGASDDLRKATNLARRIVTDFGMSELGPITFGHKEEYVFLGKELHEARNYSEATAAKIDEQVSKILTGAQAKAKEILTNYNRKLELIAQTLMAKETIEQHAFKRLMSEDYNPEEVDEDSAVNETTAEAKRRPSGKVKTAPAAA